MSTIAILLLSIALVLACIAFARHWHRRVVIEFGEIVTGPTGDGRVVKTNTVPFRPNDPNFNFGLWFFSRSKRKFKLRIVHVLPTKPEHYSVGPEKMSYQTEDGRFRIEKEEVEYIGGGMLWLRSSVGDPLGWYELHVFVDGGRGSMFRYNVVSNAT